MTLNNSPFPPDVKIMLDKERTLKYPVPAIWALEDRLGVELTRGIPEEEVETLFGKTPREKFRRIIDFLWAGLITDDPSITPEYVQKFVYLRDLGSLDTKISEAFRASLPDMKTEVDEGKSPLAESGPAIN